MLKKLLRSKYFPIIITSVLFVVLFGIGSALFEGFFSLQVFLNLFIDNAYLIVIATGMSMVLILGGIDISVGSVIAMVCMASAAMLRDHVNPYLVMLLMVAVGAAFGFTQGCLIQFFKIQPFIVTLAGLFFARGMTAVINTTSINIKDPTYVAISNAKIPLPGGNYVSPGVVIALVLLAAASLVMTYTKFGRTVYAIGGNEASANLMGLPVGKTKILVYTVNGIYSSIAGIVFSFYMLSGYTRHAVGAEMDAISSSVIGGMSLTGGIGYVPGALFGVLINGTIQTLITFQGTLSSWWAKIVSGLLLCAFIVLQRMILKNKGVGES
ncbi:MAG TPA: sugar ABC transporter permease YjfF [Ruminococcaceae bacterium]|jgi:simple sugar transport system permease protein|nr:sugar ABC transporter permease YjfF [Oscillospiraceae bacterium]HBG55049.1 sugar ABC transporter permease YjfF [Oscillospiraceae bacterium]HBQ46241.1 sugar ABC transporter permease YjfF [Oscillospiraceae bacterium]HBT90755.1 sugar ABC transporter permease YjfF [Oscillospiraceae bacterium]HCB90872.1 sugar ABC transporter permease YjfF [Oscillospiraceae bacterium]